MLGLKKNLTEKSQFSKMTAFLDITCKLDCFMVLHRKSSNALSLTRGLTLRL